MVRSAGKLAAPLVVALLAQQQQVISAKTSLKSVLKGLVGKNSVHCSDVCKAAGHSYQGWSSSWRGEDSITTCKCSGENLQVNCKISSPSYTFASCCIEGEGCQEDLDPDPAEQGYEEAVEKAPSDLDVDQEDVSEAGVPDCGMCPGATFQLTKHEIAGVLTLHNKMRAAVGTPALEWSCELMCQVQKFADECIYGHSPSYDSPIKAGENLASGIDGEFATWMWFSEYGKVPPTQHATKNSGASHFTAVVWKATKKLGCGVCKKQSLTGGGLFFCQYADSQPNWNNAFEENVPKFHGTAAQYKNAGLDMEKAQEVFKLLNSWGLHIGTALTRFYTDDVSAGANNQLRGSWAQVPLSGLLTIAGAVVALASAAALVGLAAMRLFGVASADFRSLRLSPATANEDDRQACILAEQ